MVVDAFRGAPLEDSRIFVDLEMEMVFYFYKM